ncbi:MAG: asparagine synthase (glutamine-hydrolyzing) [Gammaproteobacteria bacterium]|nr:asparagine synthase (glutamine-hydrolyzing) [Gammaproteobacteria bacterium]
MCGIAGILNIALDRNPGESVIRKMIAFINHRGPDGHGFYVKDGIGLGHARLSIIDIEGGQQPIHNEDKSIWVVFNGEIFNYIELQESLKKQGHKFYTHSDTEVIVHLYEQYGDEFVQHLNGQFSIALWDTGKKRLLLVRDRIGINPLFYTEKNKQLIFASEVKSIISALGHSPRLNSSALDQLMTFWSPVSPNTVFEGIYEVSPGQMIVVENGSLTKKNYWDWKFAEPDNYRTGTEQVLAEELHDLLLDATQIRLRSDVPVGAYLSGGLDSSVITSLIHNHGGVPLRTFSIGFDEEGLDESVYQRTMIDHLNADHSKIQCSNQDIADNLISTIWHTESPILRTAPVPMSLLSGLVRKEGYKVVLTGEGADEVLGGYDIFKEGKIRQFWARNPDSTFRPALLKKLYPYLDISKKQGAVYLKSFFGAELERPELPYFAHIPRWTTTAKCKEFFSDDLKSTLNDDVMDTISQSWPQQISKWAPFNKSQYIEAKSLMSGYLLCSQGDRMLMSNSVEGRFPFLDHRVMEFANSIHPKLKMKALNEKYLLKQAMKQYLPPSIVQRYKQPYRAPDIPSFFGTNPPEYIKELMNDSSINNAGYFDAGKVSRLVKKIERGRAIGYKDNMAFIGILTTQVWHDLFITNYQKNFS